MNAPASSKLFLAVGLVASWILPARAQPQHYDSYFLFLGDHPREVSPGWHAELQGITHDDEYWYISQRDKIWKIPATHDLSQSASSFPRISLGNIPDLADYGYDHFGDLEWYGYGANGYLAIAISGSGHPVIAFFKTDPPFDEGNYIGRAFVDMYQNDGPWCAVDPTTGLIWSSAGTEESPASWLYMYEVDWAGLETGSVSMDLVGNTLLCDESGYALDIPGAQGGDVSESGEVFYYISGNYEEHQDNDGINVFDTSTWRRIRRSSGDMPFKYAWSPGSPCWEEPEGLTVWDLDAPEAPNAPGISGQLHVLMLDNEADDDWDQVYIKHYTNTVIVDGDYQGEHEHGTPDEPFKTVTAAYNEVWDGQRIQIRAGFYPESLTLSKRLEVIASGGTATIGSSGDAP